jgi:hypothetical protein
VKQPVLTCHSIRLADGEIADIFASAITPTCRWYASTTGLTLPRLPRGEGRSLRILPIVKKALGDRAGNMISRSAAGTSAYDAIDLDPVSLNGGDLEGGFYRTIS